MYSLGIALFRPQLILFEQPGILLLNCHVGVVESNSIVGTAQRAFGSCSVYFIAVHHVRKNILVAHCGTLIHKLLEAAARTGLGRGVHKDFQLGVGEYYGANVATVHYDAAVFAKSLLHGNERMAHLGNRRYGRYGIAHTQTAYFLFHVLAVEHGVLRAARLH